MRKLVSMVVETSASAERQRNPRGEGARLRLEILTATRELLGDGEAVTLRSIARRANISAPAIYRHFADVDAVMAAVAEDAFAELTASLIAGQATTPVGHLRAVCEAYLSFAREKPQLYRVMFGGVWNAEIALVTHPTEAERFRELGMNAFGVLVEAIRLCVADGSSASDDPRRDAGALWAGLHGFAELRQTAPLFDWPADVESTLINSLAKVSPSR